MKFSIIIPVYNAQKYLSRCIESILQQTYYDWELILVDDGSSDDSWNIIKKYQNRDCRIKSIHQENAGPGIARNIGIENIEGDFVIFVDADDYIDCDYLKLLHPLAKKSDLVFIDVVQVDQKGKIIKRENMSDYKNLSKEQILRNMMTGKIPWGGVRKTISAKLLNNYNLRYSDLKIGEEALFSYRALLYAEKINFLYKKAVYMYEVHDESQSTIKMDDPWGGTYLVLKDYLLKQALYEEYADTLNAFNFSSTIVSIDRITQNYYGKEREYKVKQRYLTYLNRMDEKYKIDFKALPYKAKVFYPFIKMGILKPVVLFSFLRSYIRKIN